MSPKTKYTLVRLLPIASFTYGVYLLVFQLLPNKLGYEISTALAYPFWFAAFFVWAILSSTFHKKYDAMHRSASDDRPSDKAEAEASDERK